MADEHANISYEAENAARYRHYAEELRTIADDMAQAKFRDTLLAVAEECVLMADNLEAIERTHQHFRKKEQHT
jgi:hypothetical protein